MKARNGEYIDRDRITVTAYLDEWIDGHALEIKPRTLADYRACIRLYATPRIGHLPIQAVRPSTITKLYRDLLTSGGRDGQPLSVATVTHLHAVLRKAFRDAVIVDELIGSNPVERAKRLFAFFQVAAYTGARRGELDGRHCRRARQRDDRERPDPRRLHRRRDRGRTAPAQD